MGEAKRVNYVRPPKDFEEGKCVRLLFSTVYELLSDIRKGQKASDQSKSIIVLLKFVIGMLQNLVNKIKNYCISYR